MTLSEHEELQAAIGQLPKTGRGRRYPRALCERVLAYASSSGQTLWQVGQSLGIPGATLLRWRKPTRKKLRRVEVVKPVVVPSMLTFTTRDGHQLTGLDVAQAAELIRRLSS